MEIIKNSPVRSSLVVLAAIAALVLAACGGSSDSSSSTDGPDPATLTPADAFFYGDATIKPEGTQKSDVESALSKLTGTSDIGSAISSMLDSSLSQDGVSFSQDVEPILGPTMGGFVDGISNGSGDGAIAFSVTDTTAAQDLIDKMASGSEKDATYNGIDYKVSSDGSASGIIGDFAVAGTEQGFKDAVDAYNGDSLADNSTATDALDAVPDDTLFSAYVDPKAAVDAAVASGAITQKELDQSGASDQIDQLGDSPLIVSGGATSDSMSVQTSYPAGDTQTTPEDLLSSLPSGAWMAFGLPDVGQAISNSYQQFLQSFQLGFQQSMQSLDQQFGTSVPQAQVPNIDGAIKQATGLDITKDFGWIGNVSGFLQGSSPLDIGGGLVIQTDDPQQATVTLAKLRKALGRNRSLKITPGTDGGFNVQPVAAPIGAEVAVRDDKVVFAFAGATVDDVLSPSQTLGDADNFTSATGSLGDGVEPVLYLDMQTLSQLISNAGGASDPSYQQAAPYLSAMSYMVAGSGVSDGRATARFVLGLQDQSSSDTGTTAAAIQP